MFLMKEKYYDELLNINTREDQIGFHPSFHYHRYEPTPYIALEELFLNYSFRSSNRIVDFGCGKGRLNFYIHYHFDATVVGVEMDETFFEEATQNRNSYMKKVKKDDDKIHFHCCLAEKYLINPLDSHFYFFNPFSLQIFMTVVNHILLSMEEVQREVELILYYPSEDYIYFLENQTSFQLAKEVKLTGLFEGNPNERFLIYRLAY
jgi:SAM-dependent methyltransferase